MFTNQCPKRPSCNLDHPNTCANCGMELENQLAAACQNCRMTTLENLKRELDTDFEVGVLDNFDIFQLSTTISDLKGEPEAFECVPRKRSRTEEPAGDHDHVVSMDNNNTSNVERSESTTNQSTSPPALSSFCSSSVQPETRLKPTKKSKAKKWSFPKEARESLKKCWTAFWEDHIRRAREARERHRNEAEENDNSAQERGVKSLERPETRFETTNDSSDHELTPKSNLPDVSISNVESSPELSVPNVESSPEISVPNVESLPEISVPNGESSPDSVHFLATNEPSSSKSTPPPVLEKETEIDERDEGDEEFENISCPTIDAFHPLDNPRVPSPTPSSSGPVLAAAVDDADSGINAEVSDASQESNEEEPGIFVRQLCAAGERETIWEKNNDKNTIEVEETPAEVAIETGNNPDPHDVDTPFHASFMCKVWCKKCSRYFMGGIKFLRNHYLIKHPKVNAKHLTFHTMYTFDLRICKTCTDKCCPPV